MSEPTAYAKGNVVRVAHSTAQKVALEFDGFKPVAEAVQDADYRELQAQAKSLGIPANQPKAALAEAIANYEPPNDDSSDQ